MHVRIRFNIIVSTVCRKLAEIAAGSHEQVDQLVISDFCKAWYSSNKLACHGQGAVQSIEHMALKPLAVETVTDILIEGIFV
jgi:hypothetical protein